MPYSKQFMAPMAMYLEDCRNIGDSMDYSQRHNDDIGEEVSVFCLLTTRGDAEYGSASSSSSSSGAKNP